jgi:hypothetical protein
MRTRLTRAARAELARLDVDLAQSEAASAACVEAALALLRLTLRWERAGLSPRAARILATQGIKDLAELRENTAWFEARGCGQKTFHEIMKVRHPESLVWRE